MIWVSKIGSLIYVSKIVILLISYSSYFMLQVVHVSKNYALLKWKITLS